MPFRPKIARVLCFGVAVKAKKLRLACRARLAMLRNSSSICSCPSSWALWCASSCNALPPSIPFNSVADSPDCELWASSIITAQRRVGSTPLAFCLRSSASLSNWRETKGNFCSVVTITGTALSSACASWRESSSIFWTTPWRCSN